MANKNGIHASIFLPLIGCHSVLLVMYISGAKFEEQHSNISRDVLYSLVYCFSCTTYDLSLLICTIQECQFL